MQNTKLSIRTLKAISWLASVTICAGLVSAQTQLVSLVKSDFEIDADDWTATNNAGGWEALTHRNGGATPDSVGYISVSESSGDSATMYFVAPFKFLGKQTAAYNGSLRISLRQYASDSLYQGDDIILSGNGIVLAYRFPRIPGTSWATLEIPLNENVGWIRRGGYGRLASGDEVQSALQAVDSLWIRGEYSRNNFDRTDLDDVELLGQPSGPAEPSLSLASYAGITIIGQVGSRYSVQYTSSLAATNDWQTLTNIVLPSNPYSIIDWSSTGATKRFYRVKSAL